MFIDSSYSKLSLAIGQIRLRVMAVFSYLGGTSDNKTYFFSMWFLKIHICDVTVAATYLSFDFQGVFSIPWPGNCHHYTLCHPSDLNDLVSYEGDGDENWAVQKETSRMLTDRYSHCNFSLLDLVTGLNMKEHFTLFCCPEDLSFWDWRRTGSLFLRSCILIVNSIILDEAK